MKIYDNLRKGPMGDVEDLRGILYPTRLPTFHREPAPAELTELIRWFWIPRWAIAPGRSSRQEVLPFPASNLVVQPQMVSIAGPTTAISRRDLTGTGWAVGALLRPAALASLRLDPQALRDREEPLDEPDLHAAVCAAMDEPEESAARRRAVAEFSSWARARLTPPDEEARLANTMEELISTDRSMMRVEQVADALHSSPRTVQRLAHRYIGVPPLAMIRRYRLQEAAQRLREEPQQSLADLAADLGYADHAHLTRDFRTVLGFTPRGYRGSDQ
ncbi:AraC family transcriptional regulator [Glutamicibacter sp. X7]